MKQLFLILVTVLLMVAILVSCGDVETTDSAEPSTSTTEPASSTTEPKGDEQKPEYETITVAEALALCTTEGADLTKRYYLRVTIDAISNPTYGQMTVSDSTGSIGVYGSYSADGETRYSEMTDKPYKGYEVVISCLLQNYNGTAEVKSAWIVEFKAPEIDVDTTNYTDMTALAAREAVLGTKIKVDGVVARITYANGMIPSGFILVDDTNAIYVYDRDAAGRVKIGDTVTVCASKTYWILESELSSAQKFGYEGCCQLESVIDIKIEDTKADFNKSWIPASTVKDVLETPLTTNITTTIFKVNALVKKADGNGFVNYYFNDLDGVTGAYTYTQCNGSDFSWLDEFDGKICTVYLTVLNAKSTSSGCVYRVLPIAVSDDGYTFDTTKAPEFALTYHALGQFKSEYTGDPMMEVITTVSSELLGFSGLTLTYQTSDASVINFVTEDGKLVMHCLKSGTATVTVTATLGTNTKSETVTITVDKPESLDAMTVQEAIAATVGETVTVKGIVGPSLVNRDGFYLFNGDAMIAVTTTTEILAGLEIGQEIVIEGKRDRFYDASKNGGAHAGQTCITGATVKANLYGKQDYSTDFFITDKTLADFYALDYTVDYSTSVYVLKATVTVQETAYYTNMKLTDGATTVLLYCSSASQYNWLKAYAGQEVTIEIAPCNWNNKTSWAGCVLAVRTADGKVVNSLNFDNN